MITLSHALAIYYAHRFDGFFNNPFCDLQDIEDILSRAGAQWHCCNVLRIPRGDVPGRAIRAARQTLHPSVLTHKCSSLPYSDAEIARQVGLEIYHGRRTLVYVGSYIDYLCDL